MFSIPSLVLVGGVWKSGKTDLALLIAEVCHKLGLVSQLASNIEVETEIPFEYISDLATLKFWLHEGRRLKLYILDEGNAHLVRRRAMSTINVEFTKILSEVSKAHARLIIVAQDLEKTESEFSNDTWLRGTFIKTSARNLGNALLISDQLNIDHEFYDIPPTSIKFDPFLRAPFTLRPELQTFKDNEDMQKAYLWAFHKATWKELADHPQQWNRKLRRCVRELFERYSHVHNISVEDLGTK